MASMRKTIIFGNGLGMAFGPEFFTLDRAIEEVWGDPNLLSNESKKLIGECIRDQLDPRPKGEKQLDILQNAVYACEFLNGLGDSDIHWLSEHGKQFPEAIRKFIYETARQFHLYKNKLPGRFLDPLIKFIQDTRSHVATLNYDDLLYLPFIEQGLLKGYDGPLIDGFYVQKGGFKKENLKRLPGRDFGYYLHLHGSPLFVYRGKEIQKLHWGELPGPNDIVGFHTVLTHFRHKPNIISQSPLLLAYWKTLSKILEKETDKIILFGCSGEDRHLNETIIIKNPSVPIHVIEWDGGDEKKEQRVRYEFWKSRLNRKNITVELKQDILDFTDWANI